MASMPYIDLEMLYLIASLKIGARSAFRSSPYIDDGACPDQKP
jgi:hypothetical protein